MIRQIDYDPLTREATYVEIDDHDHDKARIIHHQDVRPIIEHNKQLALNTERTRKGIKEGWWHYASIPNIVITKWKQEKGVDLFNKNHGKKVMQLLNDPEYKYLKATHKHHDKL